MNKIIDKVMDIRVYFVVYTIVMLMTYTNPYVLSFNQNGIGYVLIAYSALMFVYHYIVKKEDLNIRSNILIYGFLLSYLITIEINRNYALMQNLKIFIWSFTHIVLIFNLAKNSTYKIDFDKMFKWIVVITLLATCVSVFGYIFLSKGIIMKRLFGYYFDPNFGSVVSTISIILSLYFINNACTKQKIFNLFNIFMQYSYITLSQSRTGHLMLIILFVLYLMHYLLMKNKLGVVVVVVFMGLTLFAAKPVNQIYRDLNVIVSVGFEEGEDKKLADRGGQNESDSTKERLYIWQDALDFFTENPIFGTSYAGYTDIARETRPGTYIAKTNRDIHNGYIIVLLCGGLVAFISVFTFLLKWALLSLKYFKDLLLSPQSFMLLVQIGILLFSATTLSEIFYQINFESAFFWLCLGLLSIYLEGKHYEKYSD